MAYLSRAKRVEQIVAGATKFFSEQGLSGQTRELSASLGIAQPLLYRYFPSKQALIDRIFIEAFENRWDDSWRDLILNRAIPVDQRYKQFYIEFNNSILTREWVRLFMYAELGSYGYGKKVLEKLRKENDELWAVVNTDKYKSVRTVEVEKEKAIEAKKVV